MNELILNKHLTWLSLFESWLSNDNSLSLEKIEKSFSIFLKYKSLLKHDITIDFAKSLSTHKDDTNRSVLEKFDDKIHEILHLKQKESFINSLKTKKYKHLFNSDITSEIHIILDNNISITALKSQFFNKLAKFKTSDELLKNLIAFKDKNIQWNKQYYLEKIKNENLENSVEILYDQNGYTLFHVKDYEACQALGSQAWCLVQNEESFNNYTNSLNRQVIAMNFNLPIDNFQSIIGLTVDISGNINNSYLKNDEITPIKTKESFKFESLSHKNIENYLNSLSHQDAFFKICRFGLIHFYHQYINYEDVDPSGENSLALLMASENGHIDIFKLLLNDKRTDPSTYSNYCIGFSSRNGHIDIVKLLLNDKRVDPSGENNFAIRAASENGHIDILKLLIKNDKVKSRLSKEDLIKYQAMCNE